MPVKAFVVKGEAEPISKSDIAMMAAVLGIGALCLTMTTKLIDNPTTGECKISKIKAEAELVTSKRNKMLAAINPVCDRM